MANYTEPYWNTPQSLPGPSAYSMGHKLRSGLGSMMNNPDLAMALLANSGGPQKRSFGEILGQSAMQAQQMKTGREDDELMRQYRMAQIQQLTQPSQNKQPGSVQEYEYAKQNGYKGSFQDWIVAGGQTSRPSAVQEWEHFQKLNPGEQRSYLEMKRSPPWKVDTVNQTPTVIQGLPGGRVNTVPLSTPQAEIGLSAARKSAEAEAGAIGAGQGAISTGIQKKGADAKNVLGMLDEAESILQSGNATGSLGGTAVDAVAGAVGKSTKGAQATAQLQVLQAGLMLNMPRMEGPQSDRDVELYRQAAASLGDPTVPDTTKLAALKQIRAIQMKYAERASTNGQPFQIFPRGSEQDTQMRAREFNNLLDKYAPRK
jgi:hypothetical protein